MTSSSTHAVEIARKNYYTSRSRRTRFFLRSHLTLTIHYPCCSSKSSIFCHYCYFIRCNIL